MEKLLGIKINKQYLEVGHPITTYNKTGMTLDTINLKIEVLGNEQPSSQSLHVAFGIDAFFAFPMGIAMTSFIANHQQKHITFHIFTDSLFADDILRLKKLSEQYNILINIYYISIFFFLQLPLQLLYILW